LTAAGNADSEDSEVRTLMNPRLGQVGHGILEDPLVHSTTQGEVSRRYSYSFVRTLMDNIYPYIVIDFWEWLQE